MTAKTSARLLQPHTTTATAATEHITGTAISHVQPGKASQLASTPMSSPNSIVFDALLVAVSVLSTLLVVAVVFLVVAIRLLRRVTAAHMSYERDYFDTNEEVEEGETTQENTWSTTAESRTTSNAVDEQRPLLQRTAPSREQQRQQRHQRRRRGVPATSLMNALRIVLGFSVDESDHDGDSDTYDASSRSDGQWQRTTARSLNHARRHDEAAHEQQRQPKVTAVHDEGAHSPLSRSPARSSADQREARVEPSSSVGAGVAGRQQSSVSGVASPTLPPSVHDRAAERQAGLGAGAAAVVAGTATNDDKKEEEEKEAEAIPFHAATHKDLVVFNTTQDSRYRLLQRIGMGAFSSVYLVQHKTTGQTYALKYILCQDDRERLAALRECEVIHSLQGHPQVIRIADMFMHYQFQPGKKARMPTTTSVNSTQLRNASPQSPSLWARPAPTAVAPASPPSLLNVPQSSQPQPQLPSSPPTHAGPQFRLPAASVSSNACGPSSVPSSNAVLAARTRSTAGVVSASPTSATAAATQWVGVQLQGLHDQVMDKLSSAMRPEDNDVLAALRARMRTADLRGGSGDVNDTSRKVGTGRGRDVVGDAAHDVDDEDSRGGRSRFKSDRRPNSSASREEEEEGTTDGGGEGSEDRTPTESKSAPLILSAADAERLLADARLLQQQGRRQRRHRQRVHETQKQHHMGHDDNHTQATTATTTTRGPAGPAAVSDGPRFHAARPSTPISPLPQCLQNDAKSASQQQQQQQGYCYQHSGMEDGRVVYAQLIPKDEMGNSCSVTDGITATMATATGPRSSTALLTNVTTHNSTSRRSSSFSAEHTRGDNEDVDATTESEGAAPSRTPASLPLDKEELRGQLLALEQQQQQQLEDRNGQFGCSRNSNSSSSSSSSSSTDSSSGAKEEPIQPIRRVWVPPPSYMQPLPSLLLTEGEANSREKLGRSSIAPPVEEEQWGKQQQQQQPSAPTSYVSRNRYANFALNADRLFEKEDGKEKKEAAVATLFTTVPRKTTPLLPPPPRTPQSIARNDAAAEADVDAPSPAAATAAAMAHSSYASRVQQQQAATVPSSYAPALSPSSLSWSSSVTPFSTRPANSYAPMRTTAQVTSLAEAAAAAAAAREDSKADTGLDWKASTLFTMESVNQSGTALTPAPHAASATCGPTRDGRVGHYVNPYLERARGGEVVPPPRTSYAPGGGVRYSSLVTPLADTASTPPQQQQQQQQQQSSSSSPSLVMRSSYAPLRYRNLVQFIASTAPAPTSDTTAAAAAPVSGVASTSGRLSVSAAIRSARAGQQGERMHLNDGKPHVHVPMPQLWGGLVPPRPFTNPNELNRTHVVYGHRRGDSAEEDGGVGQAVETPKTAHGNESHTHNSNGVHTCQELFLTGNGETAAYSDAPSPQQPLYTNLGVTLTDAEPTLARVVAKGTETTTALLSPFNTTTRAVASYGATGQTSNAVLNANNANTNTTYSCAPRARTYAPAVRYANAGNPTLWSTYGQPGGAVIGPASVAAARATAEGLKEARNNSDGSSGNEVNNADGGDAALESNPHGKGHGSSSSAAGTASATTHSHSSSLTQDVRDTGYLCLVMEYHPMGDLCHYYLRAKQQLALQEHQQQQLFMRNSVSHATFDARSTVSPNTPMSSDRSSVLCAGADAGARSNVGLAPAASSLTGGFSNFDPRSPSVMTGGSAATTTTTTTAVTTSVTGAAAAAASWITAAAAATWRMKPAVSRHSVNIAMPTTSTITTTTTTTADPNKREPVRRDEEERTDPTSCNPLTEPQLLSIGYQLASVLDHMHHQSPPIIHRDLKPENILIKGALSEFLDDVPAEFVTGGVGGGATSTEPVSPVTPANAASPHRHEKGKAGNPSHGNTNHVGAAATLAFPPPIRITRAIVPIVVTDFGLAMLQETYGGHRAGRGGGTRPYIAPECWEGGTCTASDVWSLGCVLYALATGRLTARTVRLMSEEARRDGFASRMLNDILSQKYSLAFASFVVSLLVVDPAKRPTAAQAAQCFLVTEHEVRFDSSSPFFSNVLDL